MDGFLKWWKRYKSGYSSRMVLYPDICAEAAWQEATKQKDAEIKHLKTIIESLEMSVKSFTDNRVDLVDKERARVVTMLREWAKAIAPKYKSIPSHKHSTLVEIADRIKDSENG